MRELMSNLADTLRRCHSTVRRPMNSCAAISELVRPSLASWAISSFLSPAGKLTGSGSK